MAPLPAQLSDLAEQAMSRRSTKSSRVVALAHALVAPPGGTVIELRDGKVWRQEQYDCYA
jgi:hypothetical protein